MADHRRSNFVRGDKPKLETMRSADYPQGVVVDPVPMSTGEEVTVLYHGLLEESGADQVWLHCGYGDAQNWHKVQDVKMEWTARGWVKTFKLEDGSRLNICFKDSANNWDNNNSMNWSFEIHQGTQV